VVLERLRITGGRVGIGDGPGILQQDPSLRMRRCTVANNKIGIGGGHGAGVFSNTGTGTLAMSDCTVRDNHVLANPGFGGGLYIWPDHNVTLAGNTVFRGNAAGTDGFLRAGGGIIVVSDATLSIAATVRVTENTAGEGGGGIYNSEGTVILEDAATTSAIVVNNCIDNCGGPTPVAGCATVPISCP
jgi:predicted outer membrane repeat protein